MTEITRRSALRQGFGGIALVCSFDFDKRTRPARGTSAFARLKASGPFEPFQRDLPRLPAARPVARDKYVLTMKPGTADVLPGYTTPILGYDGHFPGPTLKGTRGRPVEVRMINNGGRDLNTHLHGGVTPTESDGQPHDPIPNGAQRIYRYPSVQDAATMWYHDHAHGQTAATVFAGLAGFYIHSDPAHADLGLPEGDYDVPLMIMDRAFNSDGSFRYKLDVDRGYRGDTILVNGQIAPRMAVKRRLYRLRFLNASNARPYSLTLGNNRPMAQIASDGGLLAAPVLRTSIPLEPAERVEVLVDFRSVGVGAQLVLHNTIGEATTQAVMRFDVVRGGGSEEARVPKRLTELADLPPVNAMRKWPLSFQGLVGSSWQIAGADFAMDRIDCRPRLGSSELWTFVNNSQRTHPMHLHGYHFRIVSSNGKPPHPGDRGWKDTVPVYPNQTVVVRPNFDYYAGRYVFHCHASEHSDMSMMGTMEVVA
jgi:FtsP/CotA-like multicopper oxidase with cupredoxin domain